MLFIWTPTDGYDVTNARNHLLRDLDAFCYSYALSVHRRVIGERALAIWISQRACWRSFMAGSERLFESLGQHLRLYTINWDDSKSPQNRDLSRRRLHSSRFIASVSVPNTSKVVCAHRGTEEKRIWGLENVIQSYCPWGIMEDLCLSLALSDGCEDRPWL